MDKTSFLKQSISNYLEKYLRNTSKVKLPEFDFTVKDVHNCSVTLTDPHKTIGNIVFSMDAGISICDKTSKVPSKTSGRFAGVANVKEYEGGIDDNGQPLMLPEVSFIEIQSIQIV